MPASSGELIFKMRPATLPPYHPLTFIRDDWGDGEGYRIADAQTHFICFGATGSGKTSGPLRHLAMGYLKQGFGGLVLCSKPDERPMWEQWAEEAGRWSRKHQRGDLVIINSKGDHRFNFLDWEAQRSAEEGGGLTINIVALLDEIAGAIAGGAGKAAESGGGDNKFFTDALHQLNINLVDLPVLARVPVTLPLLRSIVDSAPQTLAQAESNEWRNGPGDCATILRAADEITAHSDDEEARADFEECRSYWLQQFPATSDRTRSIITLSFSMVVTPLLRRPLRKLFCTDTNITPEDAFSRILIIDLPVQELRLAGKIAALCWKFCYEIATLRRTQPNDGSYLRPTCLWIDEYATFAAPFDVEWAAVSRSASACGCFAVQNRESLIRVLGNEAAVDSLLGNLQCKFFGQNSSTSTNEMAVKLLGGRWTSITTMTGGTSTPHAIEGDGSSNAGFSVSEQHRTFLESSMFPVLRRGGPANDYLVDCIVYLGGKIFADGLPFKLLTFNQRT